jgi:hypothetical protein
MRTSENEDIHSKANSRPLQNDDLDFQGNTASPTGPDRAVGPEGTSRVPADDPKL